MNDADRERMEKVRRRLAGAKEGAAADATDSPPRRGYADQWRNSAERSLWETPIEGEQDGRGRQH